MTATELKKKKLEIVDSAVDDLLKKVEERLLRFFNEFTKYLFDKYKFLESFSWDQLYINSDDGGLIWVVTPPEYILDESIEFKDSEEVSLSDELEDLFGTLFFEDDLLMMFDEPTEVTVTRTGIEKQKSTKELA